VKKLFFFIVFIALAIILIPQEIQHEAIAINIEVPVRVFTKGKFVEELTIKDFEVYEDGVLQDVLALYLVKRTVIEREDTKIDTKQARKIFIPETSRTFVLIFEMMDYFPKIRETLDYFFENVISPADSLFIVTPLKTYALKKELLDKTPREVIVEELNGKLRKDIKSAASEYKSMVHDLEWLANAPQSHSTQTAAREILDQIVEYRYFDEEKLMEFKDQLMDIEGQKYIFLFYQRQIIPIPPEFTPGDLKRRVYFNVKKIKRSFADSSININFIFLTKTEQHHLDTSRMDPTNLVLENISEETFGAFNEVAEATGGITDSSANIAASFQRAVISSENYYLLYYAPKNYKADGKFRNIKVKVKGKNYKVTHRAGYIAD
jgi:VWFA-related protein